MGGKLLASVISLCGFKVVLAGRGDFLGATRLYQRLLHSERGHTMSLVAELIIGGWTATLVMIEFCALHECGMLLEIRNRIASWLEPLAADESLQPERENVA